MFKQNQVLLTGACGGELETTALPQNRAFASFSIAHDHVYKNSAGHTKTFTEWFRVVTSSPYLIEHVLPDIISKGQRVFIHGKLQTTTYNNQRKVEIWIDGEGGIEAVASSLHVNKVMMSGRLAADATIRTYPGEKKALKQARMAVYVTRGYKDAQGNWPADNISVVTRQPTLVDKILSKQATKGRLVYVAGGLRAREYEDSTTQEKHISYEVEVQDASDVLPITTIKKGGRNA